MSLYSSDILNIHKEKQNEKRNCSCASKSIIELKGGLERVPEHHTARKGLVESNSYTGKV
jgi:hypothetical protein